MIRKRLAAWFRDRRAEIGQVMTAAKSEPNAATSPEWYTGLAVSPASFSRQLGDMQISLLRANTVRANTVRTTDTPHANTPRLEQTQGRSQADDPVAVSQQQV
jgi:hypothetical protein